VLSGHVSYSAVLLRPCTFYPSSSSWLLMTLPAEIYQSDALSMGLNNGVKPSTMPLTVSDGSYDLRDHFFTPPYPHPSCKFIFYHVINLHVVYYI
jgi:hypothetical protein